MGPWGVSPASRERAIDDCGAWLHAVHDGLTEARGHGGVVAFRALVQRDHQARALALHEILEAIRRASRDSAVAGVLLRIDGPEIGWAKAESLHQAIRRFRESGKPSLCVLSRGGNSAYFVAAAAGQVALDPASSLDLHALASESFYLKDLLGEIGVEPELDSIGEFKSAGEMFSRRESSEASRRQTDEILFDIQQNWISRVAEARALSADAVGESLGRGPLLAEEALERKLVDLLAADADAVVAVSIPPR